MDTLSTDELVAKLQRLGLHGSAGALRVDVQRHLLSPRMPGYDRPGRGRESRWTTSAVRRAVYVARLRRRGVDGRVLPLLAFLRDGWGWRHIRCTVAEAVRRAARDDRRAFNRPSPVRKDWELIENVHQRVGPGPARDFWVFLVTANVWGAPSIEASPVEALVNLAPPLREAGLLGAAVTDEALRQWLGDLEVARRSLGLSAEAFAGRIEEVDDTLAKEGRRQLLVLLHAARWLLHRTGRAGHAESWGYASTNPLTLCGLPRAELKHELRHMTGRPTPARWLAVGIANGICKAMAESASPH